MKPRHHQPQEQIESIDTVQLDVVLGGCACGCGQADCNCANGNCGGAAAAPAQQQRQLAWGR
jgi:hypothetical protein